MDFLQHLSLLKKPSEHPKVLQPVHLYELESVVTRRPQLSRHKDVPQQQVILAPISCNKDMNKTFS
jgi:hypothetical protein